MSKSPGVYTSEKDLSFISKFKLVTNPSDENNGASNGIIALTWLLTCGKWDDSKSWLDKSKWEDDIVC